MKIILLLLLLTGFQFSTPTDHVQTDPDAQALSELLGRFLAGASVNDAEIHDRFWSDDLIYTSSAGERITKTDIMDGLENQTENNDEPAPVYHSEDVQIRIYGNTAVVAFKLVAEFEPDDDAESMHFFNTGTFVKKNKEWKAVAWQATRIPS